MAKTKSQQKINTTIKLATQITKSPTVDLPLNFNDSNRILCAVHENDDGIYSVYLVQCFPGMQQDIYHSFDEMQADISFPVDFKHLNPLHVLPCGFTIETQAKFKPEPELEEQESQNAPVHETDN